MTTFIITRDHISPDNEEHAAMCHISARVEGTFQDAKVKLALMVVKEDGNGATPVLLGLLMTTEVRNVITSGGGKWRGVSFTDDSIKWQIRELA